MALIKYPEDNYNSFVTISEADDFMHKVKNEIWDTLTEEDKEVILNKAFMYINALAIVDFVSTTKEIKDDDGNVIGTEKVLVSEKCPYAQAQLSLVNMDLLNENKLMSGVIPNQPYKKAKVSSLLVEYNLLDTEHFYIDPVTKGYLYSCLKELNKYVTRGFTYGEPDDYSEDFS
jgi:hypothetical protein